MHPVEKAAHVIRRSDLLKDKLGLWSLVRPWYLRLLKVVARSGLRRTINGTDPIVLAHKFYEVPGTYEPEVWTAVMQEVRSASTVVDVGAFIGLYTLAFANRVGRQGRVFAFEPDPETYKSLCSNLSLNGMHAPWVQAFPWAVGARDEIVEFASYHDCQSSVLPTLSDPANGVRCVSLDTVFAQEKVDLIKIDVEGYEYHVLSGAVELLSDPERSPHSIYVETHPWLWAQFGVTDRSLLELLWTAGYQVSTLDGFPVEHIDSYGEIVAHRKDARPAIS